MQTARTALQNARDMDSHKGGDRKQVITYAREATQAAEDARIITIRKIKEEDEAAQRKAREDAELAAKQAQEQSAQDAAQRRRRKPHSARRRSAPKRPALQQQHADEQRRAAEAQQQQAEQARMQAEQSAAQAQQQAAQMREQLKNQLNQVLQTRETARGLIVNMSDVLFDFNKYTLKPEAREKLAKVSGILLAYPNLKLQVEGYTDNIGSDEYNQKLSEQRADSVRDFLVQQSVADANITAQGYGKTHPIADNSTNSGRAQNRRVELVVSGNAIGVQEQAPGASSENRTCAPGPARAWRGVPGEHSSSADCGNQPSLMLKHAPEHKGLLPAEQPFVFSARIVLFNRRCEPQIWVPHISILRCGRGSGFPGVKSETRRTPLTRADRLRSPARLSDAASICDWSLPPASAISGLPPPEPPTSLATAPTSLPA